MFGMGIGVFGVYLLTWVADEFVFHRKRDVSRKERLSLQLNTLALVACQAVVLFVEYKQETKLFFAGAALVSLLLMAQSAPSQARNATPGENYLHSWTYILHPLMIGCLGGVWPFINGAGFFLGMVLPFSTDHLRPMMFGYLAATAGWFLFQLSTTRAARSRKAAVPVIRATPDDQVVANPSGTDESRVA